MSRLAQSCGYRRKSLPDQQDEGDDADYKNGDASAQLAPGDRSPGESPPSPTREMRSPQTSQRSGHALGSNKKSDWAALIHNILSPGLEYALILILSPLTIRPVAVSGTAIAAGSSPSCSEPVSAPAKSRPARPPAEPAGAGSSATASHTAQPGWARLPTQPEVEEVLILAQAKKSSDSRLQILL
jgi:hypothetical protein